MVLWTYSQAKTDESSWSKLRVERDEQQRGRGIYSSFGEKNSKGELKSGGSERGNLWNEKLCTITKCDEKS